jgi:hypothetical protein
LKLLTLALALAGAVATTAAAQNPPVTSPQRQAVSTPVEIHASVDRTAVWVGDPVTYLVELRCAPKVDILADDLSAERLQLRGLELLGVEVERDASVPDRVTHRIRYRLAAYEPEAATLGVGTIPVRYHIQQPGTRPEDLVPAGEVRVPPLELSLRSTIPEGSTAALRDARSLQPLPQWLPLAKPIGIGLVVLSVAPVALWGATLVARARRARGRGRVRQTKRQRLAALEDIKSLDTSSTDALRAAFARLDTWVRDNLEHATGVTAMALTPAEIGTAVDRPPRSLRMEEVQEILVECERAKYAPEPPSPNRWRSVLEEAERMGIDGR